MQPIPLLDLRAQYASIREELDEAIRHVVEGQAFVLGPEVDALEEEIAAYVGVRHAVGVASGTDALLLPLKALDAEPGAHVIVPSFTFFATAGAVWNAGFRPVFCDVDPSTFNVTAETLEAAWTNRTVAVIPVHLFGRTAPMREVMELATARGAFVLEDAAQAIGARGPAGAAGAVGDAGAFSFFPTKNLGGFGDGGLITTNDPVLAERLAKLRVHGGRQMYHHEMVGTNSRLDAMQAAVLRVKLRYLDEWSDARARNAALYHEGLADVPGVLLPGGVGAVPSSRDAERSSSDAERRSLDAVRSSSDAVPNSSDGVPSLRRGSPKSTGASAGPGGSPARPAAADERHVFNQFTIRARRRDELRRHLSEREIGSGVYYPLPLHLQQCFASLGMRAGELPVTESLCGEVLSLPIFPELGSDRIERVCEVVRAFYG